MAVEKKLLDGQLNNVIRMIKQGPMERVLSIKTMTHKTLKRLKVKRDATKARTKLPRGSDQVNVGTLFTWLNSIGKEDEGAVKQLVVIDATCCRRVGG